MRTAGTAKPGAPHRSDAVPAKDSSGECVDVKKSCVVWFVGITELWCRFGTKNGGQLCS